MHAHAQTHGRAGTACAAIHAWRRIRADRHRVEGNGESGPGADVGGASPVPGAGVAVSDQRGLCKRTSARRGNIERSAATEPRDTWAVGLRRQCARHLSTHARAASRAVRTEASFAVPLGYPHMHWVLPQQG